MLGPAAKAGRAYRELFEGGPDGYLVTDPDGVMLRANARAGELFRCGVTVVRHADGTPYRVRWSVRDIGLHPALD